MAVEKGLDCTGCGACEKVCPVGCIKMHKNAEGFTFPQIDALSCVDCGRCEKACPLNDPALQRPKHAFCYMTKDEAVLSSCASGGAFTSLAMHFTCAGDAVVGVVDNAHEGSSFKLVDSPDECKLLSGSKYYQCDLNATAFNRIEDALNKGHRVLFCGTPCQVLAIRNAIPARLQAGLYLIDIVCQGVPSWDSIHAYRREEEERRGSFLSVHKFRAKMAGHEGQYITRLDFEDGTNYNEVGGENICARAFMYQVSLRESCYRCPFARPERSGDLTLGDYWSDELEETYQRGSTSLVLENTDKGEELVKTLERLGRIQEVAIEDATAKNVPLHHPVKRPFARSLFYPLMSKWGFARAAKACCWRYSVKQLLKKCVKEKE